MLFALVDCNNFYTSCEKVFYPALEGKPVVVLSNNDGCIIARSEEAKQVGIKMGVPVFEIEQLIDRHKVHVFSTNYALYGDFSQRVMNTLSELVPDMEIYSIDEAFLDVSFKKPEALEAFGRTIRETVMKHTGIPVSIGFAATKTLAKAANHLAKNNDQFGGVLYLRDDQNAEQLLANASVKEVWGVGEKYEAFFKKAGILSALDLKQADANRIREHLGIVGQRLVLELNGTVCYPLNDNPDLKKEICTSRSFGHPIETYEELEQATTTYAGKVATKLRREKSLANSMLVFVMTNKYARGPQYVNYKIVKFPGPTNQTAALIHYAVIALKALYKKGFKYKKSGIIVSDVIPQSGQQTGLWDDTQKPKNTKLAEVIDRINEQAGIDTVKFAIQGTDETWKMRQHNLSPHYTTRWEDLLIVDLDKFRKKNN
ncbi:MAG TPA: Y-family DNA polymerase [Bacteroidales bacterium]|nr:Y-family DNA polymerase [Bacteroidales bacterium]HRX97427.1 Y-family DNA polymerase [Bacteroidales bacterium]